MARKSRPRKRTTGDAPSKRLLGKKKKVSGLLAKLAAAGAEVKTKSPTGTRITGAIAREIGALPRDFEAWVTWTLRF